MPACATCGQSNPDGAQYCMSCASPLSPAEAAPRAARKTVTILFCDVVGSTSLAERLDAESVREVISLFFREASSALERHGGSVEKYIGDAVMAVFGVPVLHEDDALRAIRAAVAIREALDELNPELERRFGVTLDVRIGLNTGEVIVGDHASGQALVVGDPVNVAARLESAAASGEILIGPTTYALVRDHVAAEATEPLELKGKSAPLVAHRLLEVRPAVAGDVRPDPPFVGRASELGLLRSAFEDVVSRRASGLFTVLGPAGVGKSRLAREFVASVGADVVVVKARCLPYGEGITFWPVAEFLRQACGIVEGDRRREARAKLDATLAGARDASLIGERIAGLMGLTEGATADLQDLFWAVRGFLAWIGRDRPIVAILDDLQWAEPAYLDLIEYLAGWNPEFAVFLLCLSRPDLLEARPGWGSGATTGRFLTLGPLEDRESEELVTALLGGVRLDERVMDKIAEPAGGNPLFLEEMLRMLEDDGLLREDAGRWVAAADIGAVRAPESIQALLGARLDRLSDEELTVIRSAAVVGKAFWRGAVADLVPESQRAEVGTHLQTLVRKDLIRPETSTLAGEDAFRFHHILIQEEAYRGTPKERRADLHEGFAVWAEGMAGDRASELEEVVGYHLEQAYRLRSDLGPPGDRERELALRAARRLASAGMRAYDRRDVFAASDLLRRASELLSPDHPERRKVLLAMGEVLAETGDLAIAEAALDEAEVLASSAGDAGTAANAAILRLSLLELTDPKGVSGEAVAAAERQIATLESIGDDLGLARAWLLMGELHWNDARYGAADDALARAVDHARRAGATREEADALGKYTGSGTYGPAPVEEMERRSAEVLERMGGTGYEAPALRSQAVASAMRGRFDEARDLVRRARAIYEDHGLRLRAMFLAETAGAIEMLAGDAVAAEREFRAGFDAAVEIGEQGFQSTVAAALAHALVEQGRLEEAEEMVTASELAGAEDDVSTQVLGRSARARILAARGLGEEAEGLAREAVARAEATDDLNMRGDTLVDLGEVLLTCGEPAGAAAAFEEALAQYEAKGNEAAGQATRRRLAALQA
ncbi:MAG TPA: adenylate/guanylate cyclase domain-containing protein [Actinomycetota bacterium]|nr:adenylate/guanylate cyclase domain-containing protein [Actinomycetota bacterium]